MKNSPLFRILFAAVATAVLFTGTHHAKAQILFVGFGDTATTTTTPYTYNNIGSSTANYTIGNLVTSTGTASGVSLAVTNPSGFAASGGLTPLTGAALTAFGGQASIGDDYLFAQTPATTTLTISNLSLLNRYTFTIFADRNGSGTRTGTYTATGLATSTATGTLDATFNQSNVLVLSNITPSAAGVITLSVAVTAGNTAGFAYLNALRIDAASAVPEPSTWVVMTAGGALMLVMARRRLA